MTSDEGKIRIFEDDPCGMNGFSTLINSSERILFRTTVFVVRVYSHSFHQLCLLLLRATRSMFTPEQGMFMPTIIERNGMIISSQLCSQTQCTCICQGTYNAELCKKVGGKHCQRPFSDPLRRSRNVLAPNEVFGTSSCFSGYEGIADGNDGFSSCHLRIYEPGFAVRHTRAIISLSTLAAICLCILGPKAKHWIKLIRRKRRHRDRHDVINTQLTNMKMKSAFEYAAKNEVKKSK